MLDMQLYLLKASKSSGQYAASEAHIFQVGHLREQNEEMSALRLILKKL